MSDSEFTKFLEQNGFVECPKQSIPDRGMDSRVDAFDNGTISLRLVVDRGQKFIELARHGTNRWNEIFEVVSRADRFFKVKSGSFTEATQALVRYWPQLVSEMESL